MIRWARYNLETERTRIQRDAARRDTERRAALLSLLPEGRTAGVDTSPQRPEPSRVNDHRRPLAS